MPQLKNFFNLKAIIVLGFGFVVCLLMVDNDDNHAFAAQDTKAVTSQVKPAAAKKTVKKTDKKEKEKKSETKLTVYYFHGYARCASCRKIEQYTKEAAETFNSGQYAGRVAFVALNVEESPNEHFVKDYQLVSKTVILQPEKDGKPGKWENLDRIWLELGDKDKFIAYIKAGIIKQLEAK